MANRTKDIWNDDDGAGRAERRSGRLRRFLVFFLTLAAVLGVVLAAAYRAAVSHLRRLRQFR